MTPLTQDPAYLMMFAAIIIIHNKTCKALVPRTYTERHWIWELIFPKQYTLLFRASHLPHVTDTFAGLQWSDKP